jgi:hypothetical protein
MNDDVRKSEGPKVRRSDIADHVLDRALASLTDASSSPALQANVMRRVAEQHHARAVHLLWDPASAGLRSAGLPARLAFAAAAVVLVAASLWFVLRPASPPQTASSQPIPRDIALPAPNTGGGESAAAAQAPPAPEQGRLVGGRESVRSQPRMLARAGMPPKPEALDEAGETQPVEDAAPAVPPIDMPLIPEPSPVAITPVTLRPIDIPDIQIPPMDDQMNTPVEEGPGKKQPGGPTPGVNR